MELIKKISAAAAVIMCVNICAAIPAVYAEDYSAVSASAQKAVNAVYINSAEDFIAFAENCRLDSYSRGKIFILGADISFTDKEFVSVPSFSGVFDGNGHKLSGFSITENGSVAGVFRYIEETGRVKDLTVSGKIAPSGTGAKCGGIAGVNRGTIYGCSFNGVVSGRDQCGGIAGYNEKNAMIASCSSMGRIQGEHYTGGIAGQNDGYIMQCENVSSVNTDVSDPSIDLDSLEMSDIYYAESVIDITDAGGITGYSAGTLQDCINRGTVGYPHIGYNVGGVCGRQNGYISGCENYGTVNGRKDTGGIVGQAEPYFSLLFSESGISRLRDRLDELNTVIDKTINDAEASSSKLSEQIDGAVDELNAVRSSSEALLDETDRIINDNVDSINELSSRMSELINMSEPVADSISDAADEMGESVDKLWEAGDMLADALESTDEAFDIIFPGLEDLSDSISSLKDANDALGDSLSAMKSGFGDNESMADAIASLQQQIYDFRQILADIGNIAADMLDALNGYSGSPETQEAVDKIKSALEELTSVSGSFSDDLTEAESALDSIRALYEAGIRETEAYSEYIDRILDIFSSGSLSQVFGALSDLSDGVSMLISSDAASGLGDTLDRCSQDIRNAVSGSSGNVYTPYSPDLSSLYDVTEYLRQSGEGVNQAGESAEELVDRIQESWKYLDEASASVIAAAYTAEEAVQHASGAASHISDAMDGVHEIIDHFSGKSEISFYGVDDSFISCKDSLSEELSDLIERLDSLNTVSGDTADILAEDLRQVNSKIAEVSEAVLDLADELTEKSTDLSDYTEDISAQDNGGRADGKIADCRNYGQINGDVSVGGIVGTMGIENSIDPEGDIEEIGDRSFDFIYQSRTVVRECVNEGEIISKKDGAGGIAGEMDTGCIINCIGMGDIRSTGGSYAGGVAGRSSSAIYGSSAMCRIEGDDYVGGIAGMGHDIHSCVSFVDIITSDEYTGAVAGDCDGVLENNVFAENGMGGIDGISYIGKAYPVSYEKMISLDNTPEQFRLLTLIFKNDDEIVGTVDFKYGDTLTKDMLPEVPRKEGYFSRWEEHDYNNMTYGGIINAEFIKNVTTISSKNVRENEAPVIMAEGTFTDEDILAAVQTGEDEWQIHIPDDGAQSHLVRFKPAGNIDRTQLRIDGLQTEFEKDGQYLTFTANKNFFVLKEEPAQISNAAVCAVSAGAVVIIALTAAVIRRKKSKTAKKCPGKS